MSRKKGPITAAFLLILLLLWPVHARAMVIQEITTPRGIAVWFVPDRTTPTLTVRFAFQGGSEADPATKAGRAHLMAAALNEGTAELEADTFQQLLADRNITLSFSAGREQVGGTLRYLRRYEETALTLAHDALRQPAFRTEDVARLQAQTLAILQTEATDPDFRAARLTMRQVFGAHAYGQAARGTPTSIKGITPADLRALHREQFTRARLLVAVVGDASTTEVARVVDRLFGALPAGEKWVAPQLTRQHIGALWYSPWTASEQNTIVFTAPAVSPHNADYPAALILNDLTGAGGFRALLMERLRQDLGATYGISAGMQNVAALDFTMGQTSVAPAETASTLALIRDTWAEATRMPFSDEAIAISKNYLSSSFTRDLTSSGAIANYVLGLRLAALPKDYATRLPAALAAVTPADLERVAARLYDPAALSFVVVGPSAPAGATKSLPDIWQTSYDQQHEQ